MRIVLGLLLLIFVAGAPLDARHHKKKMELSIEKLTERLDLSRDQVRQIEDINAKYERLHESVMASIKPLKEEVRGLAKQDSPNYTQIRSVLERMAPYRVDMHLNRIKHKNEIKSVLTPAQREKFQKAREKRQEKRRRRY